MATRLYREIERRMNALNLDPTTLAKRAGLGESYIRDLERRESTDPRRSKLAKVAKVLGCTVDDLLGERPLRRAPPEAELGDLSAVTVNELDVHVSAGGGVSDDPGGLMSAHEAASVIGIHSYPAQSFREAFAVEPRKIRIIAVRGDSMEPRLWAGQRVMVDIEDRTPSPPGIFVVWDGLGLVIKRVELIPGSDPMKVRLMSANPAYSPYELTLEEAHINGRVIGMWSRM